MDLWRSMLIDIRMQEIVFHIYFYYLTGHYDKKSVPLKTTIFSGVPSLKDLQNLNIQAVLKQPFHSSMLPPCGM